MLTIFSVPKPFVGHIATIQRNAIASWKRLKPECEIILLGDEPGISEASTQLGTRHIGELSRNEYGTPLVDSVFREAQAATNHRLFCYVNADIILPPNFTEAVSRVADDWFLMLGRRTDVDIDFPLAFGVAESEARLENAVRENGRLHGPYGIDYFVFPSGLYDDVPPFALGRAAWDNWLVFHARDLGARVVDASHVVRAIHQNHDYGHVRGGSSGVWKGPERERNLLLLGGRGRSFGINHATHVLRTGTVRHAIRVPYVYSRFMSVPVLHPRLWFLWVAAEALRKAAAVCRRVALCTSRWARPSSAS